ncbi:MAG: IMP dehydrogenase [Patescibacteria group bacterium]
MTNKFTSTVSTTFAEYLLLPRLTTKQHSPDKISLATPLARYRLKEKSKLFLNVPFTSAVMQAVSGPDLAIALAREGGLSFIYCSQPIAEETAMVLRVKDYKAGFVTSKANLKPSNTLADALRLTEETGYSTIAITKNGQPDSELLGILTDQDYWLDYDSLNIPLSKLMTPFTKLTYGLAGIALDQANKILRDSKKSCIPIINNKKERKLKFLVFKKDREQHLEHSLELIDDQKRLLVGAGINTRDYSERVPELVRSGADVLVIDTSDGYNEYVKDTVTWVKKHYPQIPIGAGNVVDGAGFKYLANAGADFVKVGIGGGSICITQEVKGIGRGQVTALYEVAQARAEYLKNKKVYIPICSDGGLVQDSHILIALSLGADFVMMGRYFARCAESPTEEKILGGMGLVKPYWGEGSDRARNWQRYHNSEENNNLPFEEGVDGWVPFAGNLSDIVQKSVKITKSTMSNLGCLNIGELHEKVILERRSSASIHEGKPHDVQLHADNLGSYKKLYWGK